MASLLLAIIYLAFISLGLPDSLLGSAWPSMHLSLNVPLSYMGFISMIISGGTIISSVMSERLTKKFTAKYVTAFSVFLTAAALFGFSASKSFSAVCVFAVPYGLGAGAIDAALNNYVALHYNSRHMSWLHCFWGVGTIISPYIMSYSLTRTDWHGGYRAVSVLQITITVILLISLPLWKINKTSDDNDSQSDNILGIKGALKIRGVPFQLIGFFAYCAAESTAIYWSGSYLSDALKMSDKSAAALASLFFIGITVGRFISGFISEKFGDLRMIRLSVAIITVGIILMLLPIKGNGSALVGLAVLGLGCAAVYPSVIHSTPNYFGRQNSSAIIGLQMACAYVGSTFIPPVFGAVTNITGTRVMPIFLTVFFVIMTVCLETVNKKVQLSK